MLRMEVSMFSLVIHFFELSLEIGKYQRLRHISGHYEHSGGPGDLSASFLMHDTSFEQGIKQGY